MKKFLWFLLVASVISFISCAENTQVEVRKIEDSIESREINTSADDDVDKEDVEVNKAPEDKELASLKTEARDYEELNGSYDKDNLPENDEVVKVKEDYFLTQINDLFLNYQDYVGATVIVEGMYWFYQDDNGTYEAVYRKGPGCCGNDGWGGFFMDLEPDKRPKENDWIRVTGKLFLNESPDTYGLYLVNPKVEVLEKRGAEFVNR